MGYADGWTGTGEISYGGQNCAARARLAEEIVRRRLELYPFELNETRYDILGINSLFKSTLKPPEDNLEVRLRVAACADTEEQATVVGLEVEALYTNGPAGGGGARSSLTKNISVASVLVPEDTVAPVISWFGGDGHEAL